MHSWPAEVIAAAMAAKRSFAALGSFCCLSQLCSYHPQMIKLMRAAMSDNDIDLHQSGGAIPNISSLSDPN